MPPSLRSLAAAPVDAGVVVLVLIILLLLGAIGVVYYLYKHWHGRHELDFILYYHTEHQKQRDTDTYWCVYKGDHRHAYLKSHSDMVEHFPNALSLYHHLLHTGRGLIDVHIGVDMRQELMNEMLNANKKHQYGGTIWEKIPTCHMPGGEKKDNDPGVLFQRLAMAFRQQYKGELWQKENNENVQNNNNNNNSTTDIIVVLDYPLIVVQPHSSLSYCLGLETTTATTATTTSDVNDVSREDVISSPAYWVSTVRSYGYNAGVFLNGWNNNGEKEEEQDVNVQKKKKKQENNKKKKTRRLSSREMIQAKAEEQEQEEADSHFRRMSACEMIMTTAAGQGNMMKSFFKTELCTAFKTEVETTAAAEKETEMVSVSVSATKNKTVITNTVIHVVDNNKRVKNVPHIVKRV